MGLRSKSFCNFHSSSSFFMLTFSLLWTSLPAFGNLVPISVSFLVCSGSDPHFNPYLAVTEINWLGSLSKCRMCTCFPSSLKLPPYPLFHYIPLHQPSWPLIKAGKRVVFFCFIRENVRIVDFCLLNLVDRCQPITCTYLYRQIVMEWIEITWLSKSLVSCKHAPSSLCSVDIPQWDLSWPPPPILLVLLFSVVRFSF